MNITRLSLGLATFGVLVIGSDNSVRAASPATADLAVSATIGGNCTITTVAVGFPAYDPIVTHATDADDSTAGSVTITCTKGAATTIGLGLGSTPAGNQMRMSDGSTPANYLNYGLFQDANRSVLWGNADPNLMKPAVAPDKKARAFPVYGRIPAGQDLPAGTYKDTVVATVNF
jgi:spore coat protein U-like protein